MDCSCGSGTTPKIVQTNDRQSIAIDQSEQAIQITKNKMSELEGNLFSPKQNYKFLKLEDNVTNIDTTA
jgi:adenine specific DNA methylase Mod